MAITLEANYAKTIGLTHYSKDAQYSSHQFSVSIKTELNNIDQIEAECSKLYATLQEAVDTEIQHPGYLPGDKTEPATSGNGSTANGNGDWNCSDKQRHLLINIITQQELNKEDISILADKRFGKDVKSLNRLEMGGLLSELLKGCNEKSNGSSRQTGAPAKR